jgi:cellulose synthase operon protein C
LKKPQRRAAPPASIESLAARGAEALRQERCKEAVETFKLLVRQDPRPEWQQALAKAYHGRARTLAAKRMFKEAAMVLENTQAPDGAIQDPRFYLECLIRDGQHQKAATHAIVYVGRDTGLSDDARTAFEELIAALLVAVPPRPDPVRPATSEQGRWLELAASCRTALDAWTSGAPAEEIEAQLARISLRSAFRPVRLLLKSLLDGSRDAERARRLLDTITPGSPFFAVREAVEATLSPGQGIDAHAWRRLTRTQQDFVAEVRGLAPAATQFLARSAEAARGGPAAQYTFLAKQPDLPQHEVRSACLNLLPQVPDRLPQFERTFGPLTPPERHRLQAMAAEGRGDWGRAEQAWRAAAAAVDPGDPQAGLMRGVIFRHLADLAEKHPEILGDRHDLAADPVIHYLEQGHAADPEHVAGVIELIRQYRDNDRPQDWHRLAEEAVRRFPDSSAVLQQATESAVARKAYKKATGFARRLLRIDPINAGVRRQMIELQVAHARQQMRSKRPDLATRGLATAYEWERADAPSALVRIVHGLVGLQAGEGEAAETRLRTGVALAGDAPGWFRAALEALLMRLDGGTVDRLRKELARARQAPPTREAVLAVIAMLGQPDTAENRKAVVGLLFGMRNWLLQAAPFDWPAGEVHALAETFIRFDAFDLLQEYARAARRRDAGNPSWRFYDIVARTRGQVGRLSVREADELAALADHAISRNDFHAANRIERFLAGVPMGRPKPRRRPPSTLEDELDSAAMEILITEMIQSMPRDFARSVRDLVKDVGREAAVAVLTAQMRDAPLEPEMPEPLLRQFCEAVVAQAAAGGGQAGRDHGARSGRH